MASITDQYMAKGCALYNGDCCKVLPKIPDDSIGVSIFSPPFSSLYSYSDNAADLGNSRSHEEFFEHFSFVVKELFRVLKPGRICAVHCMDLPVFKRDGLDIGLYDFSGDIIRCFRKHGFVFHSRHCVWKDPLIAAVRTKAIGLAHKQLCKDSSMVRTGIPDYVLGFRKKGENPDPIANKNGLTDYHGSRSVPRELDRYIGSDDQSRNKRSHWIWQQYASPVWFDIRQTKVLRSSKEKDDEKHIAPLQLDVIERCLALWSKKGDTLLTPFMGIGSEVFVGLKRKRKVVGIELKPAYFRQAVRNIKSLTQGDK